MRVQASVTRSKVLGMATSVRVRCFVVRVRVRASVTKARSL